MKSQFLTAALVTTICAGSAQAASLNFSQSWLHAQNGGNTNHDISVYDGAAGWSGFDTAGATTSGTFGDGTVDAYRFFTEDAANTNTVVTYAQRGTIIGNFTTTDTSFGGGNQVGVWTDSDPVGFTSDADFGNDANPSTRSVISGGLTDGAISVDVSGYDSGNVYIMYGGYRTNFNPAFDITMTGQGLQDIDATLQGSFDSIANNWEHYLLDISFVNDMGYETISFYFNTAGTNYQENGRFTGVVVDGVSANVIPEPASAIVGMIGIGALAMRRRRG